MPGITHAHPFKSSAQKERQMLKDIFRPKWQHSSPDTRSQAVKQLDPEVGEEREILQKLAKEDPIKSVRRTAIDQFRDLDSLDELRGQKGHDVEADLETLIHARYIALVSGEAPGLDHAQQLKAIEQCSQEQLCDIALATGTHEIQEFALSRLTDQHILQQIVRNSQSASIRQLAVAAINDVDVLKEITSNLKSRDKRALQLAREKLNAVKESERAAAEFLQRQETVCSKMESLATATMTAHYKDKHLHFLQQWKNLAETPDITLDDQVQARFERARLRCDSHIMQDAALEQQRLEELDKQREAHEGYAKLCERLEQHSEQIAAHSNTEETNIEDLRGLLTETAEQWQANQVNASPLSRDQKRYETATRLLEKYLEAIDRLNRQLPTIRKLLAGTNANGSVPQINQSQKLQQKIIQCLERIRWPGALPIPDVIADLQKGQAELQKQIEDIEARSKEVLVTVRKQLTEFEQKLDAGEIDDAKQVFSRIRRNIDQLNRKDAPAIEYQLRHLQDRLDNLYDWQHFATDPKRESLCDEMEKLITTDIPPLEKADAIKALQQEWKNLGDSRYSQELWQRFRKAADKAYEPCQAYFSEQSDLRAANLQQRREINSTLKDYIAQTDWDSVDWKAVEQIYTTAKREWRQFSMVDRGKAKPVQKEFDALLDTIDNKIKDERNKNAARKTDIINEARALLESEDVSAAIETTKGLQRQWKSIGITYRRQDQLLWKQFREVCDQIFQRRHLERQAEQQELQANLKQATELCEQIRQLANQDDEILSQSQPQLAALKDSYTQLGPLPRDQSQSVNQQYQQSLALYEQRFSGIKARSAQRALATLEDRARLCDAVDALAADDHEQRKALEDQWQQPHGLPPDWWQRIDERFQRSIRCEDNKTREDNDAALRTLCIRLEILAELTTPPEDQPARMEILMSRLSNGLGQDRSVDKMQQLKELQLEWLFTGPHSPLLFVELQKRFQAGVDQLLK